MKKATRLMCSMSGALWGVALCMAQSAPAIAVTQVRSTDGGLEGVLVQYSPPRLENQEEFADPDSLIEAMVIMDRIRPEWGIYDKNPKDGGELRAIGYGVASDRATSVVFQRGSYIGPSWSRKFLFDRGAVYAVSGTQQNAGISQLMLRPIIGKQRILSRTDITVGNPPRLIVEVHSSPPSIVQEGGFPSASVTATAVRLLLKDGSLKPEWGLFRSAGQTNASVGDLLVDGSRTSAAAPILYDNSKIWRGFDELEKAVYESDGKGSLSLKRR